MDDLVGIILFALADTSLSGPVNAAAPTAVTNRQLSKTLAGFMGRRSWLPVPGIVLRVALGEVAGILTQGQRAVPEKVSAAGYRFAHPDLHDALQQILSSK